MEMWGEILGQDQGWNTGGRYLRSREHKAEAVTEKWSDLDGEGFFAENSTGTV